jgi:hypothetical protein
MAVRSVIAGDLLLAHGSPFGASPCADIICAGETVGAIATITPIWARALAPGFSLRVGGRCLQSYVPHGGYRGDGDNQRNCSNEHGKNQAWPHQQHSTIYKAMILPRPRLHSTDAGSQFR